jgi:outer membrane protein TolC
MFKLSLVAFAFVFSFQSFSGIDPLKELTESHLIELSKGRAPSLDVIKASLLSVETQKNLIEEQYAPEIFAKGSYAETQERPVIEFIPIFSPKKTAQLGLRQKFGYGIQSQLAAITEQNSASSRVGGRYKNVTVTTLSLTFQMDLWRDAFGRVSKAERANAAIDTKRAQIEERIRRRAFEISLRKIYWSLVANREQLIISERLKETARDQVNDAQKRLNNSIGDVGEVARYEAQLASRSGQVIFLNFQKEAYLKQLKTLLPDLGYLELRLGEYDLAKTINDVVQCSQVINQFKKVPYENTEYDELIGLLRDVKSNQKLINNRYSDVDVKLFGTVKSTGVGSTRKTDTQYQGSFSQSVDDMTGANRSGYEAGIQVNIPLGDAKKNTETSKTLYDEMRLRAAIDDSDAQVVSTHTQLSKSMGLISEVIATQKMSTKALEVRLRHIRKKYAQARVSVNEIILDQDALLNAELGTINAQLEAVNVVFDYLMIFTETPCGFNRI